MNKEPLVSVVMPVYNTEKYLAEAIESVLNQTYKNFEFIIIDDGSRDRSWELIQKYAKKDKRIRTLKNPKNIGVTKTRNLGLHMFKGEYLSYLDSDDYWDKEKLKKQASFLQKENSVSIVGTNACVVDETSKNLFYRKYPEKEMEVKKTISFKSPFCQSAVLIKKAVINFVGLNDESLKTSADYDYWFRSLAFFNGYNLQENLTFYRVRPHQIKQKKLKLSLLNTLKVHRRYLFKKEFFTFKAFINHVAMYFLIPIPGTFILKLFLIKEKS